MWIAYEGEAVFKLLNGVLIKKDGSDSPRSLAYRKGGCISCIWNLEKCHITFKYHTVFEAVNCCDL